MITDPVDLRRLVRDYPRLAGEVAMLPFWLGLFIVSVGGGAGLIGAGDLGIKSLVFMAGIAAHVAIRRYYKRKFGEVRASTSVGRAVAIALLIVVPFLTFLWLDEAGVMSVRNLPALILAGLCFARAFSSRPLLMHWIPAAIAIAVVSQISVPFWSPALQQNAVPAVAGLAFVVAAYQDHRVLMRRFRNAGAFADQGELTHG